MRRHLDLVGRLFVVAGALSLLMAVSLFLLGAGALSLADTQGAEVAAWFAALVLVVLGVAATGLGVASAVTGVGIRRRRGWARLSAFAVAGVNLCVLPFGTALGVYALWVLLQEEGRAWFHPSAGEEARWAAPNEDA